MLPEPIEALVPEAAVLLEPAGSLAERLALDRRGPQLPVLRARDQPGLLEDLQVLGDGLKADRERLGEFIHGRVALFEAGKDRPPRGVRERREGEAEVIRLVDQLCG